MTAQPASLADLVALAADDLGVPGVAAGVEIDGDQTIAAYGVTGSDHGRPIDAATLFQIGSTAKTFTATAVMVLVDRGLVRLDRPVHDYLPDLRLPSAPAAAVTVGQLLNHTAGWDGGDVWVDTGDGDDALARTADRLAGLPQQFAPGTGTTYDNAAFVLAGRLVEVVAGQTFEQALATLVLEPLGLRQTLTSLNEIMTRPFALGHRALGAPRTVSVCQPWSDPRGYVPAGARLASSLGDQVTWARFQLGDGRAADGTRVLSARALHAMHAPSTDLELMPGVRMGIGWMLRDVAGVRLLEHRGDVAGQHSALVVVPERACSIVVLTNCTPAGRELSERVVQHVLANQLGLAEQVPDVLHLDEAQLAAYTGTYRTVGLQLRVVADGGRLVIHGTLADGDGPAETLAFPIDLLAGDRYVVVDGPFVGVPGEFVRDGGTIVAVKHVGRLVPRADG